MNNTSHIRVESNHIKDFMIFHIAFTLLSVLIMLLPIGLGSGWKLATLVLVYNICFPLWAKQKKYDDLFQLWLFLLPLSVFQVFPDWFLSAQLNILVFPEDGFWKIGTVSAYMAGLWAIALMPVMFVGIEIQKRYSVALTYTIVALTALLIFGISEETMWLIPIWYAQNVWIISHTAVYVLAPEAILGMVAFYAFQETLHKSWILKIVAASLVMLVYVGALMLFYFFLGKI